MFAEIGFVQPDSVWVDGRPPVDEGADPSHSGDCLYAGEVGHHHTEGRGEDVHSACAACHHCELSWTNLLNSIS